MLKKLVILAITSISLITFCGCAETAIEARRLEDQAKKNTLVYIKNKYDFVPTVIGTESITQSNTIIGPDFNPSNTGMVKLSCRYQDRIFDVEITGETSSTNGYDNYQHEDIMDALKSELKDILGIKAELIAFDYGIINDPSLFEYGRKHAKHLIKTKFVGTNLDTILEDNYNNSSKNYITIVTVGADLASIPQEKVENLFSDVNFRIYNFKNELDMSKLSEYRVERLLNHKYEDITEYYIFMESIMRSSAEGVKLDTIDIKQVDDIYYLAEDNDKEVNIKECNDIDSKNIYQYPELAKYSKLTKTYTISGDNNNYTLHIWIPKDSIKESALNYEVFLNFDYVDSITGQTDEQNYHSQADKTYNSEYIYKRIYAEENQRNIKFTVLGNME